MSKINILFLTIVSVLFAVNITKTFGVCEGYNKCKKLSGGGWKLVRHVGEGSSWFLATDNLMGTEASYGGVTLGDEMANCDSKFEWNLGWKSGLNTEFLFANDDCSVWMITHYVDIFAGKYYSGEKRYIQNNSQTLSHTCSQWYHRKGAVEDPKLSLSDWPNNALYAEGSFKDTITNGGRNVWVRERAEYNSCMRKSCMEPAPEPAPEVEPKPEVDSAPAPEPVPSPAVEPFNKCKNLSGGGWKLVRHVGEGSTWFSSNDKLMGTGASYGDVTLGTELANYDSKFEWNLGWKSGANTEFLFANTDCSIWMVTHYVDIFDEGRYYANEKRYIHNNSQTFGAQCSRWYNREGIVADPLISIGDWADNAMYAQGSLRMPKTMGRNVWVRENSFYNSNNKHVCSRDPTKSPTTSKPTSIGYFSTTALPTKSPTWKPTVNPTMKPTTMKPTLSPFAKCITPFDIFFVVDGSKSVGTKNFATQVQFIARVTRQMAEGTRVGFIKYAKPNTVSLKLDDSVNHFADLNAVANYIENIVQPTPEYGSTTYTKDALMSAFLEYKSANELNDGREKLLFLATDGVPSNDLKHNNNQNPCADSTLRTMFDAEGIRVFEVAIDFSKKASSLQCLPKDSHKDIFEAKNFTPSDFHGVTEKFLKIICPKAFLRRRFLRSSSQKYN